MTRREAVLNLNSSAKRLEEVFKSSPKNSANEKREGVDREVTNFLSKYDLGFEEQAFDLLEKLRPHLRNRVADIIGRVEGIYAWTTLSVEEEHIQAGITPLFPIRGFSSLNR